jgi:hypothetical protein
VLRDAWEITDEFSRRIDVENGPKILKMGQDSTIWDAMRRVEPGWFISGSEKPFDKIGLGPREYHPRMARPLSHQVWLDNGLPDNNNTWQPSLRDESKFYALARSQLTTLTAQLARICRTVHPDDSNLDVYGDDIRNLLILACTEAEMHWRGVLLANGYCKKTFTVKDYVKLVRAMKLDEYAVIFKNYPWLQPFIPFHDWRPDNSLDWYKAYNSTKHDKEESFRCASLRHTFQAISACVAMVAAQFGEAYGLFGWDLGSFCAIEARPAWQLSDSYLSVNSKQDDSWVRCNFQF